MQKKSKLPASGRGGSDTAYREAEIVRMTTSRPHHPCHNHLAGARGPCNLDDMTTQPTRRHVCLIARTRKRSFMSDSRKLLQKPHLFKKGKSGHPKGRPPGSRHKATLAPLALLEGEASMLTRRAIDAALGGDMVALRLCLERIVPPAW